MSQFIESIAVKDGVAENLSRHQLRVDKTLNAFAASKNSIVLSTIIESLEIPKDGLYKLRIVYDLIGEYLAEWAPYQIKQISNFALVDTHGHNYNYKFANRGWITEALALSGKDEILMHDRGILKDSSYANIVLYDGTNWLTPEAPLLEGTQRARLIQEGIIQTKPIHIETIKQFQSFKLINAMMDWGNAVEYSVTCIE
jgi:4-amino-4-deoxychorismate lyase